MIKMPFRRKYSGHASFGAWSCHTIDFTQSWAVLLCSALSGCASATAPTANQAPAVEAQAQELSASEACAQVWFGTVCDDNHRLYNCAFGQPDDGSDCPNLGAGNSSNESGPCQDSGDGNTLCLYIANACVDASDCTHRPEHTDKDCAVGVCGPDSTCTYPFAAPRAMCTEGMCDGQGRCVKCVDDSDCTGVGYCYEGQCVGQ